MPVSLMNVGTQKIKEGISSTINYDQTAFVIDRFGGKPVPPINAKLYYSDHEHLDKIMRAADIEELLIN